MLKLTTRAANTIRDSHSIRVYATAVSANTGIVDNLPITSGTVVSDASSQVRRTATVGFGLADLWPSDPFSILSPIGSELLITYGIVLQPGTVEYINIIRGPITQVTRSTPSSGGDDVISVTVADRSSKVAEARFDAPVQTIAGATTVSEISRLITAVLPIGVVVDTTGSTKVAPQMEIERERWSDGVEKLADSIGAEVYATPDGNFLIRPEPTLSNPPVWTLDAGDGGILVGEDDEFTRDLTYNRVVASGQRTDGIPPVYAVSSDTNPLSPTYINGPFGIKTRFYASPLLTTVPQCQSAADSMLDRVTGNHMNVTFRTLTNPALEAGDVIRLVFEGRDEIHIIDRVEIPLVPGDPQQIKTRSLTLPEESFV
jgi:hypothetical protein